MRHMLSVSPGVREGVVGGGGWGYSGAGFEVVLFWSCGVY